MSNIDNIDNIDCSNKFYGPDYIEQKYGQQALDSFEEDFGLNGWDLLTGTVDEQDAESLYDWKDVV